MIGGKIMGQLFIHTMKKLKRAIEEKGSIRSLAEFLDMNPSTVSRWFAEGRSPDFRGLAIILEHLGVRIVFPDERVRHDKAVHSDEEAAKRTDELERENGELKSELLRKEGAIAILKEQLTEMRDERDKGRKPYADSQAKEGREEKIA